MSDSPTETEKAMLHILQIHVACGPSIVESACKSALQELQNGTDISFVLKPLLKKLQSVVDAEQIANEMGRALE